MKSPPKLCINCKHLDTNNFSHDQYEWWRCEAPQNKRLDNVVTGGIVYINSRYAEDQRADSTIITAVMNMCGKQGRWWEPKE